MKNEELRICLKGQLFALNGYLKCKGSEVQKINGLKDQWDQKFNVK